MEITKGFSISIKLLLFVAPLLLHVSSAQQCGSQAGNAQCQSGYCCSIYGYCGTTTDYCGPGNCPQCPSSSPPPPNGSPGVGTPSGCLKKNGIAVGWLPNEDNHGTMAQITSNLGAKACFYGLYSQITSSQYDDSQLTSRMPDITASGAILQAAVMPTKVKFADISPNLASQIATSMKKFTDNGVEVWLRFAHEMNWYVTDGTYAGGSKQEFVTAWRNVANVVKGNPKIKMFWSPNNADVSTLSGWWPGPDYVDIVGIDIYPSPSAASSFSGVYGNFIRAYSTAYNKPFVVGETGATDDATKKTWLTQLSSASALSQFPSYAGFAWFEYLKDGQDFRVVTGSVDIAKPILVG